MAWNGSNDTEGSKAKPSTKTKARKPSLLRGIVAGALVVALAVGAYFVFKVGETKTTPKNAPKGIPTKIAEVRPAPAPKVSSSNAVVEAEAITKIEEETWLGEKVLRHECKTNNTLIVETFYTADGKKHKYYHDQREEALPSGADQILAMMTGKNSGFGAPPMPHVKDFESELGRALQIEIIVNDDDPPSVKEVKERVIAARKEILELMAEGKSANDVLREWERMQEDNATVRLTAVKKVREMLDSGDREGARLLCDSYNAILEKSGIMRIELPEENSYSGSERRKQ